MAAVEPQRSDAGFILRDSCYPALDQAFSASNLYTLFAGASATGKTTAMTTFLNSKRRNPENGKDVAHLALYFKLRGPFPSMNDFTAYLNERLVYQVLHVSLLSCLYLSVFICIHLSFCRLDVFSSEAC
jgi:hypothetical protein